MFVHAAGIDDLAEAKVSDFEHSLLQDGLYFSLFVGHKLADIALKPLRPLSSNREQDINLIGCANQLSVFIILPKVKSAWPDLFRGWVCERERV